MLGSAPVGYGGADLLETRPSPRVSVPNLVALGRTVSAQV